jgi:hypothetical protein
MITVNFFFFFFFDKYDKDEVDSNIMLLLVIDNKCLPNEE